MNRTMSIAFVAASVVGMSFVDFARTAPDPLLVLWLGACLCGLVIGWFLGVASEASRARYDRIAEVATLAGEVRRLREELDRIIWDSDAWWAARREAGVARGCLNRRPIEKGYRKS